MMTAGDSGVGRVVLSGNGLKCDDDKKSEAMSSPAILYPNPSAELEVQTLAVDSLQVSAPPSHWVSGIEFDPAKVFKGPSSMTVT
jgi:hypothetical protein